MNIPLDQFEHIIDETILKRGLSYFKNGDVTEFTEISRGQYQALVSGSEIYTVQLKIENNSVVSHLCDCPYDWGPICKHIAAVLFYLQKDTLDFDTPPKMAKAKKSKSVTQQTKEILKTVSHNELIEFVENNCKKDKKFRNYFIASFGHLSEDQSKRFYQKQIRAILNTAAGREGFINWSEMKYVVKSIDPFLNNAEKYLSNKNYPNAIAICTALLEEMMEAFQFADDSNGDLGYFMDFSMEMLSKIVSQPLPKELKTELFDYCIDTYKKDLFSGWDWHLGILHLAGELTENEKQADRILACLNSVKDNYEQERAQAFMLDIIKKHKSGTEAQKFIEQNISNPNIRRQEIANAIQRKDFGRAIDLSEKGIKHDEKDKPGLVMEWYDWLLKIAQAQKNTHKIIEYARLLLIDDFRAEQDYYQILKNHVEQEQWHAFVEAIIMDLVNNPKRRWIKMELIQKIYIKEAWWDKLFEIVKNTPSLNNLEDNEKYLLKSYTTELIDLYGKSLTSYLKNNVGRNHYQTVCRYLRRIKKLGGEIQVKVLIENFRTQYPQRRALIDELNRV